MARSVRLITILGSLAIAACNGDDDGGGGGGADAGAPGDAGSPADAGAPPDAAMACAPSTTTCEADVLTVCSAAGVVEQTTTCALGCAEDEPRCNLLAPSNALAPELDLAASGPDVYLAAAAETTIDTDTGAVVHGGAPLVIPSSIKDQGPDLPPIRVLQVQTLSINNPVRVTGSLPLAIAADGGVELTAPLIVAGRGAEPGPGARRDCGGGTTAPDGAMNLVPGAGGGGSGTAGSAGGDAVRELPDAPTVVRPGGAAGGAVGAVDLVPLRGGCDGGDVVGPADPPNVLALGGGGGGALQIASASWIHVRAGGVIDAGGGGGVGGPSGILGGSGGGAGGAVLLEAPFVRIDATVAANGGGGACVAASGEDGQVAYRAGSLAARGGACVPTAAVVPGDGGNGGSKDAPPTDGGEARAFDYDTVAAAGGGGGGAVGRIRIRTRTGTMQTGAAALLSPAPVPSRVDVR